MSEPLHIVCPNCARTLRVAGATAGRQIQCPQCHQPLTVPDSSTAAPNPPPRWQIRAEDGKTYGPVTREELLEWIDQRRVTARCQVAAEDSDHWKWASELFPQLASSTPASSPYGRPFAPYGGEPPVSDKSRLAAGLLGLLLPLAGLYGVHRLYLGHIGLGILMLITCGGCGIWQLVDVILVFAGSVRDADGLPLSP